MTDQFSDESLSAYIDGRLEADESAALEDALAKDASLKRRLDDMARADKLVAEAFPLRGASEADMKAADALAAAFAASPRAADDVVAPFAKPARRAMTSWAPTALAASLALVVGGLTGVFIAGDVIENDAGVSLRADAAAIDVGNPLYAALETAPSLAPITITSGRTAAIVKSLLTFQAVDGRYCREFEIAAEAAVSIGVACREEDAHWTMEILLAADDRAPDISTYQPASGYNDAALELVLSTLQDGAPFDADQERDLIENEWARD